MRQGNVKSTPAEGRVEMRYREVSGGKQIEREGRARKKKRRR